MKLNLSTAAIIKPAPLLEASNKLCVTPRGLTVSSSLMSKMGYPKAIKLYVENKHCDCVLCQAGKSAEEAVDLSQRSLALAIAEIIAGAIG